MSIFGDIYSREADGIYSSAGNHTISIAANGSVYGFVRGITLAGSGNTITNAGQIAGASQAGIFIDGTGANITNSGSIQSGNYVGVELGGCRSGGLQGSRLGTRHRQNSTRLSRNGPHTCAFIC
jgi:hypothetical protein